MFRGFPGIEYESGMLFAASCNAGAGADDSSLRGRGSPPGGCLRTNQFFARLIPLASGDSLRNYEIAGWYSRGFPG